MLPTTDPLNSRPCEYQICPLETHSTQEDGASKLPTTDPLKTMEDQSCKQQTHSRPWRIKVVHCRPTQGNGGSKLPTTDPLKTMDDQSCPLQTHSTQDDGASKLPTADPLNPRPLQTHFRPWSINIAHSRPSHLKTMEHKNLLQAHPTQEN
jgi:hypothetical protein